MAVIKFFALLLLAFELCSQNTPEDPIEIDFLSSYYQQDGDHAAVTGGKGTEGLSDLASHININIPLSNGHSLFIQNALDVYSSASTDNIDAIRSSASSSDLHYNFNASYKLPIEENKHTLFFDFGFSTEYDYNSLSLGFSWQWLSDDQNQSFYSAFRSFFDTIDLIYPSELRFKNWLNLDTRNTYQFTTSFSQVLSKRTQVMFLADFVYQEGLLSTPFHRVFFKNSANAVVEQLPNERFKSPVAMRINYFINEDFTLRSFFRYYSDDFNLKSSTSRIALSFKLNSDWISEVSYRYYDQTKASYFAPFQEHLGNEGFFTSDYDLSAFNSKKYALNLAYYPIKAILNLNLSSYLSKIVFASSIYQRSDGLKSFQFSLQLSFDVEQ